jgi:hypothetical protein
MSVGRESRNSSLKMSDALTSVLSTVKVRTLVPPGGIEFGLAFGEAR